MSNDTGIADALGKAVDSVPIPDSMIVGASEADFRRLLVGLIERNHATTMQLTNKVNDAVQELAIIKAQDLVGITKTNSKRLDDLEATNSVIKWIAGSLFGALVAIIASYFALKKD